MGVLINADYENSIIKKINSNCDRIFNKALAGVVEGRKDLKTTMMCNQPPEELIKRLSIINSIFQEMKLSGTKPENKIVLIENSSKKIISLEKVLIIGRSEKTDISLDYEDVSFIHASLFHKNNEVIIKDEQSTNGTYLNGKKITDSRLLISGDIIQIGSKSALVVL